MTWYGLTFSRQRVLEMFYSLIPPERPDLRTPYLMNRGRVGVALRDMLEEQFLRLPEPGVLVVDFAGVEEMTGSVAEEIGPRLVALTSLQRAGSPERYLIYDNLLPEVRNELDAWFARSGQCVPAFLQKEPTEHPIIGALPVTNLMEVLDECYRRGPLTSADLERSVAVAAKKLADLNKQYPWLLHRQKILGGAPRQWYYLIIPLLPMDRMGPPASQRDTAGDDYDRSTGRSA